TWQSRVLGRLGCDAFPRSQLSGARNLRGFSTGVAKARFHHFWSLQPFILEDRDQPEALFLDLFKLPQVIAFVVHMTVPVPVEAAELDGEAVIRDEDVDLIR